MNTFLTVGIYQLIFGTIFFVTKYTYTHEGILMGGLIIFIIGLIWESFTR